MGEIADLFATLGLRVNAGQWAQGTQQIQQTQGALNRLGTGTARQAQVALGQLSTGAGTLARILGDVAPAADRAGAAVSRAGGQASRSWDAAGAALKGYAIYLAATFGYERLIKFNSTVEDSKNKIAGMLALTKKTNLSDELGNADMLMANLQQRAAKLPGTTAEYVSMLSNITRPIIDAKLSMQDLEDITVGAVVAAKALGVDAGASARDIDQALRGQYHSVDQFTGKLLGSIGYEGEEGRSRFNALTKAKRAEELKRAINQPQIQQLAEAQGKTFSGVLSTLQDSVEQFFGKVGQGMFGRLKGSIEQINAWLEQRAPQIQKIADVIGDALASAFEFLGQAISVVIDYGGQIIDWIGQLIDGGELLKSVLTAIGIVLTVFAAQAAIAFATNPIVLAILAITALVYAIRKLINYPGGIKQAFSDAFDAIAAAAESVWEAVRDGFSAAFDFVGDLPVIKQLIWLVNKLIGFTGGGNAPQTETERVALQRDLIKSRALPAAALPDNTVPISDAQRSLFESGGLPKAAGRFAPKLAPDAGSVNVGPVSVGDIHINAPNADPVAVSDQVRKVFHEELGNTLRKTMDAYG